MKKVAFILPGFYGSTTERGYQEIAETFKTLGYQIAFVEIQWRYKRVRDYMQQFQSQYLQQKGEYNIILGFSYGALVAFECAPLLQPNSLFFCSISPYFAEDWDHIPYNDKKELAKQRTSDIKDTSFNKTARQIKCPTTLFVGEHEQPFVHRRVSLANQLLPFSKSVQIANVGHAISEPNYFNAVKKELLSFNSQSN